MENALLVALEILRSLVVFAGTSTRQNCEEAKSLLMKFKDALRPCLPEDDQFLVIPEGDWRWVFSNSGVTYFSKILPFTAEDLRNKDFSWLLHWREVSDNQAIAWSPELIEEFENKLFFSIIWENPMAVPHAPLPVPGWPGNVVPMGAERSLRCPPAQRVQIGSWSWGSQEGDEYVVHRRGYFVLPDMSAEVEKFEDDVLVEKEVIPIGEWSCQPLNPPCGSWGGSSVDRNLEPVS